MDFVAAFIAWLDWQSDKHLHVTALVAVTMVDRMATGKEIEWWAAHPMRSRALVGACLNSGMMVPLVEVDGWGRPYRFTWDYDVRDLRDFTNVDYERTWCEVRWTLNRMRARPLGFIE